MDNQKYTEKDFQDYAGGVFSGDKIIFEDFLSKNEYAQKQVAWYKALNQGLKEEKIPGISFDLASRVVGIIEAGQKKEQRQEVLWKNVSFYGLVAIFLITLIVTVKYSFPVTIFEFLKDVFFWICVFTLITFVCLFHYAELRRKKTILSGY
jgi:hypothetical protein